MRPGWRTGRRRAAPLGVLAVAVAMVGACSSTADPVDDENADGGVPEVTESAEVDDSAGTSAAPPPTDAPATTTTTSTAPTTTTEPPPAIVPAGVRWSDGVTFEEVGGGFDDVLSVVDDDLWLSAARYNSAFVARSTDAGRTWNEVPVTAAPASAALRAFDVVRGADGRLVIRGSRATRCQASIDLGNGFVETGLCRRSRPVMFISDDDGASWREVAPGAMAPPGDSSVFVESIVVTDAGYLAAGTVRGPDWHVRLWSSPDGETWSLEREIRGISRYASAEQLIAQGDTLALVVSEHPCATPNDNTPGWILGSSWVRWPRLYTGTSIGDLDLVPAGAHPFFRDLDVSDCDDLGSLARIGEVNAEYPLSTAAVIGGRITMLEAPVLTDADVAAQERAEADDDDSDGDIENPELTSGTRRLARLDDGGWTLIEIEGVQSPRLGGDSHLVDVDGVPGIVETRSARSPLLSLVSILPDGDGSWVQRESEVPVVARAAVGAVWIDGTMVVAGRSIRDPFNSSIGPGNPQSLTVWTSAETSGERPQTCEFGSGAQCRFADLTQLDGYPDFAGTDLTDADLSFATFGDADFSGSNFSGAVLWGVTAFSGSTVRGADFTGAQLQDSRLYDVVDADLTFANLRGADLKDITGATLAGAILASARLSFVAVPDLSAVDLDGARLEQIVPPDGDPYEISLSGLDLTGVTISGAFQAPLLTVVSLDGSTIDDTDFVRVDLTRIDPAIVDLSLADVWDSSLCPDGLPPDDPPIGTCIRGLTEG